MTESPSDPSISVVIPAHDAAATLPAQLDALVPQAGGAECEIVIVDNASKDETVRVARDYAAAHPNIRVVDAHERRGPSYARNAGARAARGELLVFCDADDVVSPTWLAAMVGALDDHDYAGGPIEVSLLNPAWLADGRGRWGVDRPGMFGDLPFAHGCNLGIRRMLYLDIGGLDEELFVGEEIDLAIRLRRNGIELHFVADAPVHYRYRGDVKAVAKQAYSYGRGAPALMRRGNISPAVFNEASATRRIAWLVAHAPSVRDRAGRVRWVWTAANLCGRTVGRLVDR